MSQAQLLPTAPCPFSFKNHEIRTIQEDDGTLWFAAKDVCAALGIGWNGSTLSNIPGQWQGMRNFRTPSGNQRLRALQEPGVYKLAFRSNKEDADEFTNWVASDVVPSIRKTGSYTAPLHATALEQAALATPNAPITPDQQCTLQAIVKGKVEALPEAERHGGLYPRIWSRFNNHFRIAKYSQLPQSRLSEAVMYLTAMDITPARALPEAPPSRPALVTLEDQIAPEFAAMREHALAISGHAGKVYEIVRRASHPVLNRSGEQRAVQSNNFMTKDRIWHIVDNAIEAAEFHAKAMCGMCRM